MLVSLESAIVSLSLGLVSNIGEVEHVRTKRVGMLIALCAGLVVVLSALWVGAAEPTYVGSEQCSTCHLAIYDEFIASGHPYKLRPAEEARAAGIAKPSYVEWNEILYVIGGYDWKARYVGLDGFIITGNADGSIQGRNQYNLATEGFVDYHPGEEKPYNCGSCHTTGYSAEGNQLGLEGLVGTWALEGVQCEACHGPGSEHAAAADPTLIKIDTSSAMCGQCHIRGDADTIPASGGFIRHHEQYNEILQSPHVALDCVTCHDPHLTSGLSIKDDAGCASCHDGKAEEFEASSMELAGLDCTSCHMPEASKSAVKQGPYQGDIMTHLFEINDDPTAKMFSDDGAFANGYLTLDYVCLSCHADRDIEWAASYAEGIHSLGK